MLQPIPTPNIKPFHRFIFYLWIWILTSLGSSIFNQEVFFFFLITMILIDMINIENILDAKMKIWANQPIHLFVGGCLNPCLQGTSVQVGSPQLINKWGKEQFNAPLRSSSARLSLFLMTRRRASQPTYSKHREDVEIIACSSIPYF